MARHKWTEEENEWLKCNREGHTYEELKELFNDHFNLFLSFQAIKVHCTHVLRACDTHYPYTKEQDNWLKENALKYKNYDEVAKVFNEKFGTNKVNRGIQSHCVRELKIISGRQSKVPAGYNSKEIGAELVTAEGYVLIKVSDTGVKNKDWITKQRYIYQQYYGEDSVTDKDIVIFLDGDRTNYSIDNLKAVPRKVSLRMNSNGWKSHSKDFTLSALTYCELYYALKEETK